jgi:hypothetical protein
MMVDKKKIPIKARTKVVLKKTTFSPITSSRQIDFKSIRGTQQSKVNPTSSSSSKYDILKQLANIKTNAS